MDESHKVHYERVPMGSPPRGAFILPRDVVARLGGDDVAHAVMADTFGFHPVNVPVGTIPSDAVRDAGGRRVISKFIEMVRRRDAEGHADGGGTKLSKTQAGYHDHGTTAEHCAICTMFEPSDNSCTLVKGEIAPKGWCKYFERAQ